MYDNQVLKNYLKDRNYDECISILKEKIVSFVINKIKKIDDTFDYTTVPDLVTASVFYLNDSIIALNLHNALSFENPLDQFNALASICERYNIK